MSQDVLNFLDAVGSLLSGVASMIALISVLLAIAETRRSRKQSEDLEAHLQREAEFRVYGYMLDVDRFFFENPDVRPYVYSGRPLPEEFHRGGKEYERLMAVAEMVVDLFDCIFTQTDDMSEDFKESWCDYLATIGSRSDLLRYFVTQHAEWYEPPFLALFGIEAAADKDAGEPPRPRGWRGLLKFGGRR